MAIDATGTPWPYQPPVPVEADPHPAPNWECPAGTCDCHAHAGPEEPFEHKITLFDEVPVRMPRARCRVLRNGILLNVASPYANEAGELLVRVPARTRWLELEWAPTACPRDVRYPFRKRYYVFVTDELEESVVRRLANLGYSLCGALRDNVLHFQVDYGLPATGEARDALPHLAAYHDGAGLPPRGRQRRSAEPEVAFPTASTRAPDSQSASAQALAPHTRPAAEPGAPIPPPPPEPPSSGAAETGALSQGAAAPQVVPTADLRLRVRLHEGHSPLLPVDVTVALRPIAVPSMSVDEQERTLLKPHSPGLPIGNDVEYVFIDVPLGWYAALAHVETSRAAQGHGADRGYALGSAIVQLLSTSDRTHLVIAHENRPILSVADPLLDLNVEVMQRRRKVLAVVFKYLPMSVGVGKPIASSPPHEEEDPPYDQGMYARMWWFAGGNSCTSVNGFVMEKASGSEDGWGYHVKGSKGWVAYSPGLVPSAGDCFLLVDQTGHGHHCGIVVRSLRDSTWSTDPTLYSREGETQDLTLDPTLSAPRTRFWLTADGGQRNPMSKFKHSVGGWRRYDWPPDGVETSEAAYIVPRLLDAGTLCNLYIFPGASPPRGYRLAGWRDITHPRVAFPSAAYDREGTEADYRAFRRRALAIPELVAQDREHCSRIQRAGSGGVTGPRLAPRRPAPPP